MLHGLHKFLTLKDPLQPADLIFVLAGRMDRKHHGLELYRTGIAPRLLLSVGRYEVSKMAATGFGDWEELINQRNKLAADKRHFFCEVNRSGTQIEPVLLPRWNTYGEILGLQVYLQRSMPRRIIVVSSDVHLCRVALTIKKVFAREPLDIGYYAVPTSDRRYVLSEIIKLAAYKVILGLPEGISRRIMRLRNNGGWTPDHRG